MSMAEIFKKLECFDSGTIGNVVAGYHKKLDYCLRLYKSWGDWYTGSKVKNFFPQFGRKVGYAVTCVIGPEADDDPVNANDVIRAIAASPKPVIVVMKSEMPEELQGRATIFGGNMATAFQKAGMIGFITDGQIRDYEEIDALGIPCIAEGLCPAHGGIGFKAVQVDVNIDGMAVVPGNVIHMDRVGAVKFPAEHAEAVLDRAQKLSDYEAGYQQRMKDAKDVDELIAVRTKKKQ